MDNKAFIVKVLDITSWPVVLLILGLQVINLLPSGLGRPGASQYIPGIEVYISAGTALGTIIAAIAASAAAHMAFRTWKLERLPIVHAMGTFIISKEDIEIPEKIRRELKLPEEIEKTNRFRDYKIEDENSFHTVQLINVGRGPAKNIIPSVGKEREKQGKLLEAINPHSFSLPSNQGTKVFNEILRVHGQRFVRCNEYELEFENDRKTAHFYIRFEDYTGKPYLTKVKISKVDQVDDRELNRLLGANIGIEVWKVMDNIKETTGGG